MKKTFFHSGYVTLLGILLLGALGVTIATSMLILGVGNGKTGLVAQQAKQANALAHACAEEALQEIRNLTDYTGTDTLSLGQGSCTYTVTNTGAETRMVTASGTVGTVVRRVQVGLNGLFPQIVITSWQEVSSF